MSKRCVFGIMTVFVVILALTMTGCSGGGADQRIISGPRIGMITTTEVVINWDTLSSPQGAVSYWAAAEGISEGKILSRTGTDRQSVTITNLKPNTKYKFIVEGDSTVRSFTTATTEDNTSFVFVTMADNRGPSDTEDLKGLPAAFINIINDATKRKAVFAVNAGDIFFGKNPDIKTFRRLYQSFKKAIHPLASQVPYYISPGNHEMSPFKSSKDQVGFDPVQLFKSEFPQPAQLKGYEGTVFSWDYGKVHFVSMATNQFDHNIKIPENAMYYISDAQISWLDDDLQKAKSNGAQFIFVFGHANAYYDLNWPETDVGDLQKTDISQRDKFWDVLVKFKVDAYICGHRHFSDVSTHREVVQWMNGNSGSVPPADGKNQYTVWTVDGSTNTVKAELVNDTGTTDLTRTFSK
jgi:hypothetical protein